MITETFTFNGTEFVWYKYTEPLDILNASDINNAQSNIETLKTILDIHVGNYGVGLMVKPASLNTPFSEVVDTLNAIEYNLDVLNTAYTRSVYYGESYSAVAGGKAHNTQQIWRWFQILNDLLPIAKLEVGKWGHLLCTDGFPTINGKRILLRGDLIG